MIDRFTLEYAFLSNFFESSVYYEGIRYPTVEHAFQAAKTFDEETRETIARCKSPRSAKSMGRKVKLRKDWEQVKVGIMETLVRIKFQDPELAQQLLDTGDQPLIEGNTWNDRFWGVCNGSGRNQLGKILMKVRQELQAPEQKPESEST